MRWTQYLSSFIYLLCLFPRLVFGSSEKRRHPFHNDVCLDLLDSDASLLRLPLHDIFVIIPVFNIAHPNLLVESVSI